MSKLIARQVFTSVLVVVTSMFAVYNPKTAVALDLSRHHAARSVGGVASVSSAGRAERQSYAGAYFGVISAPPGNSFLSDGAFAVFIDQDNTGVMLAYQFIPAFLSDLPAGGYFGHTDTFVSRRVIVDDNGDFSFDASGYSPTSARAGGVTVIPSPPISPGPAVSFYHLDGHGNISDSGLLTGQMGSSFLVATKSVDNGPAAGFAGSYAAGAAGTSRQVLMIVGADGKVFVVILTTDTLNSPGMEQAVIGTPSRAVSALVGYAINAVTGTVDATGKVNVPIGGFAGAIDPTTGTVSATTRESNGSTTTFVGLNAMSDALARDALLNFSVRANVAGSPVLLGFVITGAESKSVLLRAAGPALKSFGVSPIVAAPRLDLRIGATLLATDIGWSRASNSAAISAAASGAGAFPFLAGSQDSAIMTTLAPGAYTAAMTAADGQAGIGLLEVYDVSGPSLLQRLANVSIRGVAGIGDGGLLTGLVVVGAVPKRLLIRAAGPALAKFGVGGILAHPVLTVESATGSVIASNSEWSSAPDAPMIADAAAEGGAFPFDAKSADAALVINLAPGSYAIQVAGLSGTNGDVLLEVYELK